MSSHIRRRLLTAAAGLAAGAAVAAPAATAAPVDLAGGQTTLRLDAGTAAALGDLGLSVAPVGPARVSRGAIAFPVTGGAIDPRTAAGRIDHSGGLAFRAGGTTVRVTDFVVRTGGRAPVLTAAAGGARLPLLALDLDDAAVLRRGPGRVGTWVVRVEASLTARGAAALNAAFGSHLAAGTPVGRVDVRTRPAELHLSGGATTLSLDPGTAAALTSLGVTPSVIAPATAGPAGLAFPVTGGTLAAGTFAGTIAHSGGIALTAGATRVELRDFLITVDDSPDLSARVGDTTTRVPLAVDLSAARTGLKARTAVVRGARVSLTADAAAALNAAFGTSALAAGVPLGTADVRARVR
ncbi:MAG: hypothetical protein AB7I08_18725 [Thermoleophilia bacterium]